MPDLSVNTINSNMARQEDNKNNVPSTARMMIRYAFALPVICDIATFTTQSIKNNKRKKTVSKTLPQQELSQIAGREISQEVRESAKKILEEMERKPIDLHSLMLKDVFKYTVIFSLVGAGVGYVMKKITDKYPDNKFVNGINYAAKVISFDFFD